MTRAYISGLSLRAGLGTLQRTWMRRVAGSTVSPTFSMLPAKRSPGQASTSTDTGWPGWTLDRLRSGRSIIDPQARRIGDDVERIGQIGAHFHARVGVALGDDAADRRAQHVVCARAAAGHEVAQAQLRALRFGARLFQVGLGRFEVLARQHFAVEQLLRALEGEPLARFVGLGLVQVGDRLRQVRRIEREQGFARLYRIAGLQLERHDAPGDGRGHARGEVLVIGDAPVQRLGERHRQFFGGLDFERGELRRFGRIAQDARLARRRGRRRFGAGAAGVHGDQRGGGDRTGHQGQGGDLE